MDEDLPPETYFCLAGHDIPTQSLDLETQIETLDQGARVRICREHGCPIGIRRPAATDGKDVAR
jgi:hypothetical protein